MLTFGYLDRPVVPLRVQHSADLILMADYESPPTDRPATGSY